MTRNFITVTKENGTSYTVNFDLIVAFYPVVNPANSDITTIRTQDGLTIDVQQSVETLGKLVNAK